MREERATRIDSVPARNPSRGYCLGGDSLRGLSVEEVLTKYRPLIRAIVASHCRRRLPTGVDRADLEQEAARQLCELVHDYEPERGVVLTQYLRVNLRWRVSNYLRAERRRAGHLPIEAASVETIVDGSVRFPSDGVLHPRLARALSHLSPRQRGVIAELYWRERSVGEISRELGLSHQRVSAIRRHAEARLRDELTN